MRSFLCLYLFLIPLLGLSQSKSDLKIFAVEQFRFTTMIAKDTVALRDLLADDLVYIHSNALTEDKQTHISAISTGRLVYERMNRESVTVRRTGKFALTNGIIQVNGTLAGTPFAVRLRYTAVYHKQHGKWRLRNWQSTKIA